MNQLSEDNFTIIGALVMISIFVLFRIPTLIHTTLIGRSLLPFNTSNSIMPLISEPYNYFKGNNSIEAHFYSEGKAIELAFSFSCIHLQNKGNPFARGHSYFISDGILMTPPHVSRLLDTYLTVIYK